MKQTASSSRSTAKSSRKGFRKEVQQAAEHQKKIAEFDQKHIVSWGEVDENELIERQYDHDLEEIYEEAEAGRRNYEYYRDQGKDTPSNRENRRESLTPVFHLVELIGLKIADYPEYRMILDLWFRDRWQDKEAEENWTRFCAALSRMESGNRKQPRDEEAIIKSCKKWRPICERLNEAFKALWKQEQYQNSGLCRKKARGLLAEKLATPVKDVEAIEWYLQKPSRIASKSTPLSAMLRMVAHEFPGIGEKTVEKIWGDYLDAHPEERRRRKSTPRPRPIPGR